MAQINDAKKATLANLGYTGPIDEAYHNYLAAETGSDLDATQDLEKLLFTTLGYTGSLYDMWFEFLRDNGFTNSLQDMLYAFWNSDDAGLSPLHFSEFYSPLEYTAVPTRAAAGTTATFTRATTSTWPNNDGYMVTGVAGEIGFPGARRVYNRLTFTEDIENAAWLLSYGGTGAIPTKTKNYAAAPDGTTTAQRIQFSVGAGTTSGDVSAIYQLPTATTALTHVWIKSTTGADQKITLRARASSTVDDNDLTATSTWTQVSKLQTGGTAIFALVQRGDWKTANTADILIWHPQCEDVTAQTTQTAGEYVSVGVESAPYYHGSFVDGVKCFPTDLSGNPLTTMERYKPEAAATNLNTYSNDASGWGVSGVNTTRAQVTGPDGASNSAVRLTETAVNAQHYDSWPAQAKAASAIQYTFSFLAKKGTRDYVGALIGDAAGNFSQATFNLNTGVVSAAAANTGTFTSSSAGIRYSGNGWYLVWITATTNTAVVVRGYATMSSDGTNLPAYLGDITKYVDVTGGQIETGSVPTSRIRTTTVAVTRNADILTYTGGDVPNLKTLLCTFRREVGVSNVSGIVALSDGTTNNYAEHAITSATANSFQGGSGGFTQWNTAASSYTAGTASKAAWSAATNDVKGAKDGVAVTQDTVATMPISPTQLNVGHVAGSFQLNGNVGGIYGWTRNFSQSELNAVTV